MGCPRKDSTHPQHVPILKCPSEAGPRTVGPARPLLVGSLWRAVAKTRLGNNMFPISSQSGPLTILVPRSWRISQGVRGGKYTAPASTSFAFCFAFSPRWSYRAVVVTLIRVSGLLAQALRARQLREMLLS